MDSDDEAKMAAKEHKVVVKVFNTVVDQCIWFAVIKYMLNNRIVFKNQILERVPPPKPKEYDPIEKRMINSVLNGEEFDKGDIQYDICVSEDDDDGDSSDPDGFLNFEELVKRSKLELPFASNRTLSKHAAENVKVVVSTTGNKVNFIPLSDALDAISDGQPQESELHLQGQFLVLPTSALDSGSDSDHSNISNDLNDDTNVEKQRKETKKKTCVATTTCPPASTSLSSFDKKRKNSSSSKPGPSSRKHQAVNNVDNFICCVCNYKVKVENYCKQHLIGCYGRMFNVPRSRKPRNKV